MEVQFKSGIEVHNFIVALGMHRQVDLCELEARLVYRVSPKTYTMKPC